MYLVSCFRYGIYVFEVVRFGELLLFSLSRVQFKHEAHLFVDDCAGLLVVCLRPPEPVAGCRVEFSSRKEKVCDCERQRTWTNSAQWLPKAGDPNPQPQSKMLLFTILNRIIKI